MTRYAVREMRDVEKLERLLMEAETAILEAQAKIARIREELLVMEVERV